MRVHVDCGGIAIIASVTKTSAEDLQLTAGTQVYAAFKASAVHLIPLADEVRTTEPTDQPPPTTGKIATTSRSARR